MDLDLLLYPASLDELMDAGKSLDGSTADVGKSSFGKVSFDPNLRRLVTPSPSAAVRSLAAADHAKAVRSARRRWTNRSEEEEEEEEEEAEEEEAIAGGLDAVTERKLRESPHWKHLAWTLDKNDDLW